MQVNLRFYSNKLSNTWASATNMKRLDWIYYRVLVLSKCPTDLPNLSNE